MFLAQTWHNYVHNQSLEFLFDMDAVLPEDEEEDAVYPGHRTVPQLTWFLRTVKHTR